MPTRRNPPGQPILQHDQLPQQQVKQEQQSQQSVAPQQSPLQPHTNQKAQAVPIKRENAGVIKRETTGPSNVTQLPALTSHHRPSYPNEHPTLGSWEPSITNTIPYEELTRQITDFLFYKVVKNDDPCLDWTGSGGPILEIEAKLGHLVHKQTQQRLSLPIVTEAVIVEGYRDIAFRSTMTEAQHKSFNRFLNDRFAECQPKPQKLPSQGRSPSPSGSSSPTNAPAPPKHPTRVPMKYRHTKERDTFHEVPPREMQTLPPLVMKLLGNGNKKPKIRLTTDESGTVIKKIIKCRVADLNVFSPGTAFDWRVSVNLEMPYTGEVDEKSGGIGGGKGDGRGGGGERNKDRMSYECLDGKFTVDLTQVTSTFETSKKEHELEIEMDSLTLKKHGTLAAERKENGFQEYVKGFVDNVRVLCKVIPVHY
ncbi:mRNA triphosphatase CET1 [Terfezia boudieri ATCC MYA-4762]|uniref:mRNA-capping enzyme subunit beta n=1 Tax=Terfezia boudieri ATCC MYA-4762 TaxID=1051890 RepID=A0A3N4M2Q9_9PEZI|nr:mRNA triphosphatase CET1 [Terfezia boudieri ATCC MYA-4762]